MPADLSVGVAGLALKNPIMAGAGEATADLAGLKAAVDAGASAVVAKSANESEVARRQLGAAEYLLLDERWHPAAATAWAAAPHGASLFCRSGTVGVPFERWVETIAEADRYATARDAFVVGSLIVADPTESARMARTMQEAGLRWIELNVGAPHASEAPSGAIRAASNGAAVEALVAPVRRALSVPLSVKLGSEGDPVASAEGAVRAGADAVCLAGRYLGFLPDVETRRPMLGTFGAIGGAWALPLTLRWVAKARARLGPKVPLIGTNGARDGLDVVRFLLAGASAVEMTTVVLTDGPQALTRALHGLEEYLQRQATTAAGLVGEAADRVRTYQEIDDAISAAGVEAGEVAPWAWGR